MYTYSEGHLIASEKKDASGNTVMRSYQNYDTSGQLVGQSVYLGDVTYSQSYAYNTADGSLKTMNPGTGETLSYTYDGLKRLTAAGNDTYTKNYTYRDLNTTYTTEQVQQLQYTGLPTTLSYGYTYDAVGNIATYTAPGKGVVTYTYDIQGQLLSAVGDETYTYTYDTVGNILTANGHTYTYGNTQWRDLLTAFDGETITYDASGNPLSYYNGTHWTFAWENGRSLATANDGTTSISYAYDANGLRTSKVVNGVIHNYYYASGQLMRETYGNNTLDFFYDANGYPYALKYNGTTYYYITNLQGDVMYLIDANENTVAAYEYDPYGNIVSATGTMAEINPLRYRGYYYDAELEMYYLQSRYYDPQVGRFINADVYASTGTGVLGCNMFAYCNNNPICFSDHTGALTDGQIHNSVLAAIILSYQAQGYYSLSMHNTQIYYNGKNFWGGWGYCDLYDKSTGEVWELKKNSTSYTCTTKYAKKQLGKYVNGRLSNYLGLSLSRGGDLVFGKCTYTISDTNRTYTITYWQECQGILRYSYTSQKRYNPQAEQQERATMILVCAAVVAAGFLFSGGSSAALIPYAPVIIDQLSRAA